MATYYFDTSVLVKRYISESGSVEVDRLFREGSIFTSVLTYAEIFSTFYRLHREGFLDAKQLKTQVLAFERDWQAIHVLELTFDVLTLIPELFKRYALRGADGVHLATALFLEEKEIEMKFIASDLRLIQAAKQSGLRIINPTV
ncbi:MAG: type II toxin-antitoxin system VapC family toxin [Deltaproteobacteria bacterium]|nr:type II toxin-antitoxin system VapC family toxin [Deltaproteobacteria bacterium]